MSAKVPKAWLQAGTKKVEASPAEKTQVNARIDMSAEVAGQGLCPECRQPMGRVFANGFECYVCHPDRIAIPVPDVIPDDAGTPLGDPPLSTVEDLGDLNPGTATTPTPKEPPLEFNP